MIPSRLIRFTSRLTATVLAGVIALAASAALAQDFPALSGRVVDQAELLSPAVEAQLTQKLEALERESSDQVVVATVSDLQGYEIEDYANRLAREWRLGQADVDNGVLLLVAPNERKVRIEVGYGLEGILTDFLSSLIISQQILPAFRDGDYERGVVQGVESLDQQLRLDPAEAAARAAEAEQQAEQRSGSSVVPAIVITFLIFGLFMMVLASAGRRGRRRRGGNAAVWTWAALEALSQASRSSGGGRSSWGGGSWGGGGFSGGGGGFGGGGASGGW